VPVARRHSIATLGELVAKLKTASNRRSPPTVIEAMATNETFFFRDKLPFDHFRDTILPALIAARGARETHPHWCHRGLDRAGALFAGDASCASSAPSSPLSRRD